MLNDLEQRPSPPPVHIRFGASGNALDYAGEGWAGQSPSFCWSLGHQSTISFPRPREPRNCRLSFRAWPLFLPGVLERQRVTVFVNQRFVGYFAFDTPAERTAYVDVPWDMIDGLLTTTVMFRFPDATSPKELGVSEDRQTLAMAFAEIALGGADAAAPADWMAAEAALPAEVRAVVEQQASKSALFRRFESLGHDCEFGIVQKAFEIHSLGLLRYAAISADGVAALLEGGLAQAGQRENLWIDPESDGEMVVHDRLCDFKMHTFNVRGIGLDEAAIIDREARRLPRIARKLQEDIEEADKIFVFVDPGSSGPAVARMVAALRSHADNTLLWVRKATPDHPPGLVVAADPGLILAFVPDRPPRVPGPGFADPDLECWATVCERALACRDAR